MFLLIIITITRFSLSFHLNIRVYIVAAMYIILVRHVAGIYYTRKLFF